MGKKKTKGKRKASRSDKRMQKLYADAIQEVKKRNINLDDLPDKDSEEIEEGSAEREKVKPSAQKAKKNPTDVLRKQEQLRKPRVSLSVPVSKLVPFKPDERGLEFPRDFRRDSRSSEWIPRSVGFPLFDPGEVFNGRRSPSSEFNDEIENISVVSDKETPAARNDLKVDEILQVLPLRIGDADSENPPGDNKVRSHLPPIYRQEIWQETMRQSSTTSRSIPAKQDSWNIEHASLMVGKQELYTRQKCKTSVSLAERRFRLRTTSSGAVLS